MSAGIKRLQKEYTYVLNNPNKNFISHPDPDNIFDWYYCIYGLEGQYKGGVYFGMLKFPKEYPFKPPSIIMITPSGRFECG
jgi:ubiquitin-conjugating enzyme E2 J2